MSRALRLGTLLAAALLVLALTGGGALAFVRSRVPSTTSGKPGPSLFWRPRSLPFTLNDKGSQSAGPSSLTAARESFPVWSAPSCTDITFPETPVTTSFAAGYVQNGTENTNLIVWRETSCSTSVDPNDECWDCSTSDCLTCGSKHNCWDQSSETIAVTTTTFSRNTGEIFDADIEFNGVAFVFTTIDDPPCPRTGPLPTPLNCVATDVKNTLVHEIGHFIGFDHTTDPETTMYRSADIGETKKRTLSQDDINAVCTVYPRGQPTPTDVPIVEEAKTGSCNCAAAGPGAAVPWALLLAGLALGRRRLGRKA